MAHSDVMKPSVVSFPVNLGGMGGGKAVLVIAAMPIVIFLLLPTIIVVPMALTKGRLLQFPPEWISIHSFLDYFNDPQWIASTITSFKVAILAVVISCIVGVLTSMGLHGKGFRGRGLITGVVLAPIVVPLVVLALADYVFFARVHMVGNWFTIGLAHSLLATPYVFVTMQASLAGLNPALVRSARSLGAGPIAVWRHVYWPTTRPAIFSGAIFAFAVSFDEVVIAFFLQDPHETTLPVRMFTSIQFDLTPKIAAVAALLLGIAAIALAAQALLALRGDTRAYLQRG